MLSHTVKAAVIMASLGSGVVVARAATIPSNVDPLGTPGITDNTQDSLVLPASTLPGGEDLWGSPLPTNPDLGGSYVTASPAMALAAPPPPPPPLPPSPPPSRTPEPSSLSLVALGAIGLLTQRKRRAS
ncbi:MAG: PEP-CTERM sorting domain-containing protein [Phycisphaerales bacterium]|nr:PEP-CTERM sorting domain-containing protein [Phycisphaerales bacterium]